MKGTSRSFHSGTATSILRRDGYTCIYCDGVANVVDHVVPYCKGGKTITANGVACCTRCNMKKKGKLSEEYLIKGLTHLVKVGEDIGWVDDLYTSRLAQLSSAQEYALELLLRAKFSHPEISFVLDISEEAIRYFEEAP